MKIATAGPLAQTHSDRKVKSLAEATALAEEEAARMDTGFRLEVDSAQALAHVCAKSFVFFKETHRSRFVKHFTDVVIARSLGRVFGAHDYALRIDYAEVSRKDTATAFAALDAAHFLSTHDPLPWDQAVAIGSIYAHAYTYSERLLIEEYTKTFARLVRAK